jgi:TolB protein
MRRGRCARVWGIAATAAIVVAAGSLPAQAAYPGANGRIAFEHGDNGSDIFSVKPSGKGQRELAAAGTFNSNPVWAPSGRRLLYIRGGDTFDSDLMVMRRNGNKKRKVVEVNGGVQDASWSPNGKQIVFTLERPRHPGDIFIVDSDGSDLHPISTTRAEENTVAWSPSGDRIAFVSNGDIWTMDTSGGDRQRVTVDGTECRSCGDRYGGFSGLDWAPGGRRLVFAANQGDGASYIYTIRQDGNKRDRLAEGMYPSWSPNGKRIAFSRQAPTYFAIFTMRANGTHRYRVTRPARLSGDFYPDWGPRPTAR